MDVNEKKLRTMSWFNIFKPEKKMKPLKQTKWEKAFYDVDAAKDIHTKMIKAVSGDPVLLWSLEKCVIYLEDSHNAVANALFSRYHEDITRRFKREGLTFIYAPKEAEKIAKHYGMPVPDAEWNAATVLEMLQCQCDEPIGSALVIIAQDEEPSEDSHNALLHCISLDADSEKGIISILKTLWQAQESNIRYRASEDACYYGARREEEDRCMRSALFTDEGESENDVNEEHGTDNWIDEKRECLESPDIKYSIHPSNLTDLSYDFLAEEVGVLAEEVEVQELTEEDEQLLIEIGERVEKLRQRGIRQIIIEQFVRMTVRKSHLMVSSDARILLTDYNKEVQMLPIDKVVYIFYLRHPEGISIKGLVDHKEELMELYARVLGKAALTDKQKASVERLCDPWDNSINEKLSRIRKSFCAEVHDSVADSYVIQGARGENRYISLDEELIELGDWGR